MAGCHSVLLPLIVVPFSKESCKKLPSKVGFLAQHYGVHSYHRQVLFPKGIPSVDVMLWISTNSDALLSSVSGEILNVLCLKSLASLAEFKFSACSFLS